jgi:type III restriction enzyme
MSDILINPEQFVDEVSRVVNICKKQLLVDGIKYEKIAGSYYEMKEFHDAELE